METIKQFFQNTEKPEGLMGKIMVSGMNKGHYQISSWGISHIPQRHFTRILDAGCGGGMNAKRFLKIFPKAEVTALDHSMVSLRKTVRLNRKAFALGRLRVIKGDVSRMPFCEASFDLVTAFETVYFWPGPLKSFREVYRILAPGGFFVIVNECGKRDKTAQKWMSMIDY